MLSKFLGLRIPRLLSWAINEMLIVGIFLYRFNEHGQLGTEIVQRYVRGKLKREFEYARATFSIDSS
jgi:hypothetical protein